MVQKVMKQDTVRYKILAEENFGESALVCQNILVQILANLI